MFLTAINFAKKSKTKIIMATMESVVTGHRRISFRNKSDELREILAFDPLVEKVCVYKELKKVRTMRGKFQLRENYMTPQFDNDGNIIEKTTKKRRIPTLEGGPAV